VTPASSTTFKRLAAGALILFLGAGFGAGAARIAESAVAERVADDAQQLDRLARLAESAALMQAAVNQAVLLAGTERPSTLATTEAEATIATFETLIRDNDDEALVGAATWMIDNARQTLTDAGDAADERRIGDRPDEAARDLVPRFHGRRDRPAHPGTCICARHRQR
jgi:hypothetical protein